MSSDPSNLKINHSDDTSLLSLLYDNISHYIIQRSNKWCDLNHLITIGKMIFDPRSY